MDLEPTREVYALATPDERLRSVEEALDNYRVVVRETPRERQTQVERALMPFVVSLRRQRVRLRNLIAHGAQD